MKKALLVAFCCAPLSAMAQDSQPKHNKFGVGLTGSTDYCTRTIKAPPTNQWQADLLDDLNLPAFGFTVGLASELRIGRRFAVEAGLQYARRGWVYKTGDLTTTIDPETGTAPPGATGNNFRISYNYHFVEIPLKAKYFLTDKKFRLFVTAGLSTGIFLKEHVAVEGTWDTGQEYSSSRESYDFPALHLSALGGVGIQYQLTEHFLLQVQPQYQRALTPLKDTPNKFYLWSAGCNIGAYLRL